MIKTKYNGDYCYDVFICKNKIKIYSGKNKIEEIDVPEKIAAVKITDENDKYCCALIYLGPKSNGLSVIICNKIIKVSYPKETYTVEAFKCNDGTLDIKFKFIHQDALYVFADQIANDEDEKAYSSYHIRNNESSVATNDRSKDEPVKDAPKDLNKNNN